jgi:hypothetical protein
MTQIEQTPSAKLMSEGSLRRNKLKVVGMFAPSSVRGKNVIMASGAGMKRHFLCIESLMTMSARGSGLAVTLSIFLS